MKEGDREDCDAAEQGFLEVDCPGEELEILLEMVEMGEDKLRIPPSKDRIRREILARDPEAGETRVKYAYDLELSNYNHRLSLLKKIESGKDDLHTYKGKLCDHVMAHVQCEKRYDTWMEERRARGISAIHEIHVLGELPEMGMD